PGGASRPGTARQGVAPMGERIAVNGSPHGTERARQTLQVDVQAGDERLTASHSLYFGHFSDKVNREFRKSHRVRSPEQATRPDPPGARRGRRPPRGRRRGPGPAATVRATPGPPLAGAARETAAARGEAFLAHGSPGPRTVPGPVGACGRRTGRHRSRPLIPTPARPRRAARTSAPGRRGRG